MNIIKEFYRGNLHPGDRYMLNTGEFNILCEKINKDMDILCEGLSDEKKKILLNFAEKNTELACISEEECFVHGFRLGVKFMCDVFYGKSDNFKEKVE